jgi:hypothetical protein
MCQRPSRHGRRPVSRNGWPTVRSALQLARRCQNAVPRIHPLSMIRLCRTSSRSALSESCAQISTRTECDLGDRLVEPMAKRRLPALQQPRHDLDTIYDGLPARLEFLLLQTRPPDSPRFSRRSKRLFHGNFKTRGYIPAFPPSPSRRYPFARPAQQLAARVNWQLLRHGGAMARRCTARQAPAGE